MGFAEAVDCPVMLIADIDRGGVFAHLVGTLALLAAERARSRIGASSSTASAATRRCSSPGLDWLERRTGKPVLGVLPYLHGLHLDAEDALRARAPDSARADDCASSCRCCRASATTPTSIRCACIRRSTCSFVGPGAADSGGGPDRPAGQQERARRPRVAARAGLGPRARAPSALRRQGDRDLRRLPDAGPSASTIRTASKASPGAARASTCSTIETDDLARDKRLVRATGTPRALPMPPSPATRFTWA